MKKIILIALVTASFAASAQNMYRCSNNGGTASYQDTPCNKEMQIPKTAQAAPMTTTTMAPSTTTANNKAMDEAFQRHMMAGEFTLAKNFAVSDAQRSLATKKEIQLRAQCDSMQIKVREAESNNKHMNGKFQHRAEAAQSQYNLKCGH